MKDWIEIPVYKTVPNQNTIILTDMRVRPEQIIFYGVDYRPLTPETFPGALPPVNSEYEECVAFKVNFNTYYTPLSLEEFELLLNEKVKNLEQRQEELDNEARRNEMSATAERTLRNLQRNSWLDTRWSSGNEGTYRGSGQTFPTTEDPY